MGENSKIEWCDHTFNPWIGCTKVSPACANCYAEAYARRVGGPVWGNGEPRRRTSEAYWRKPKAWNRKAEGASVRPKVFCASLADVFDAEIPADWRLDLWRLIASTRDLDWLLLTKRPENIARMLPAGWGDGWPNVWIGTTVENQKQANRRVPPLLDVPAARRFLSVEPMLGAINLRGLWNCSGWDEDVRADVLTGEWWTSPYQEEPYRTAAKIHWVICGGESGPGARPLDPASVRSLRDQCLGAGVPFLFKQWGELAPGECADAAPTKTEDVAYLEDGDWRFERLTPRESAEMNYDVEPDVYRLGKAKSGRLLDGELWDQRP